MEYAERFHVPDSHDFGIHIRDRAAARLLPFLGIPAIVL